MYHKKNRDCMMRKCLFLNALCCMGILFGSIGADEHKLTEPAHMSLGDRKAPDSEYARDQEKRYFTTSELQEKGVCEERSNDIPSLEMLAEREKCLEENEAGGALFQSTVEGVVEKGPFFTTHPGALHYVQAVTLPFGDPVQLEDGSIWGVYSGDGYKTLNWLMTDNILITPNRHPVWYSIYPYCLLNQQTGVTVQATPSAGPWFNGYYTHWIYSIDYYNCQVLLNDGSIWNVPFCDSWILNSYLPGDYVTMGFNDSPGNGLGANILINFNTLQYVYSNCIYY